MSCSILSAYLFFSSISVQTTFQVTLLSSWKPCMTLSHFWESNCTASPYELSLLFPVNIKKKKKKNLTDLKTESNDAMQEKYSPSSAFHVWRSTYLSFSVISSSKALSTSVTTALASTLFLLHWLLPCPNSLCLYCGLLGFCHHQQVGKGKSNSEAIFIWWQSPWASLQIQRVDTKNPWASL